MRTCCPTPDLPCSTVYRLYWSSLSCPHIGFTCFAFWVQPCFPKASGLSPRLCHLLALCLVLKRRKKESMVISSQAFQRMRSAEASAQKWLSLPFSDTKTKSKSPVLICVVHTSPVQTTHCVSLNLPPHPTNHQSHANHGRWHPYSASPVSREQQDVLACSKQTTPKERYQGTLNFMDCSHLWTSLTS